MTFDIRSRSADDCERCPATGRDGQCDRCVGHPPPHRTLTKSGAVEVVSWTDDDVRAGKARR